ncbi:MAG: glucose-6-phosphate dehydrogenase assembly protein OpcA [Solirubrobacteraceae bacterium]|jgi:glucose-6-phosphate dehydrogenase assembly protein OpcA
MSEDVWSEQDTHPDAIEAALRELLRERHAANEALAPARVLNLVVVVDREWKGEIANRLERAGRYNASRTVLCAVEEKRTKLDAVATVRFQEPQGSSLGVMHENVEIDLGPHHLRALQTIVDPVLVSEIPTVMWSPHGHDEALEALMPLIDVVLIDSDDVDDPAEAFRRAERLRDHVYVVDLAWLRTTPWRERLAATFDLPERLAALREVRELEVRHRETSMASALLLAGWLSSRLHWESSRLQLWDGRIAGQSRSGDGDEVLVALQTADQEAPGLAGVTVSCADGTSLSLQRGLGGLDAQERTGDGAEHKWKILGASRGEGGILGEGVRQALLRDPTYVPALDAARELAPA